MNIAAKHRVKFQPKNCHSRLGLRIGLVEHLHLPVFHPFLQTLDFFCTDILRAKRQIHPHRVEIPQKNIIRLALTA